MVEALPEPVKELEPVIAFEPVAEQEPAAEPVSDQAIEQAAPAIAPVAPAVAPPLQASPELTPEPPLEVTHEPTPEPEPEPAPAPVAVPVPAAPAILNRALKPQRSEEEKAAARLVARQKKLDEGSEESPFSVIVGQVYDGPMDLLLDLIRKQDIDIYDIPIARITAQFLAYVNQLKAGDMDVAGEFIYTASLLIHIKSRMLLPRTASEQETADEDPRRELVERLLEHERFKSAAQMLQQKQMLEAATWTNPGLREFKDDQATEPEIAADTDDLVRIFRDILDRARTRPVLNVSEDSVTVGQMIQFLARRLTMEDKPVALRRLLRHTRSERALVAMFLALLEMVRLQAVLLRQDRAFSDIFIKKHTGFDAVINQGLTNALDDWR
jgi:segregation and condensation protein A